MSKRSSPWTSSTPIKESRYYEPMEPDSDASDSNSVEYNYMPNWYYRVQYACKDARPDRLIKLLENKPPLAPFHSPPGPLDESPFDTEQEIYDYLFKPTDNSYFKKRAGLLECIRLLLSDFWFEHPAYYISTLMRDPREPVDILQAMSDCHLEPRVGDECEGDHDIRGMIKCFVYDCIKTNNVRMLKFVFSQPWYNVNEYRTKSTGFCPVPRPLHLALGMQFFEFSTVAPLVLEQEDVDPNLFSDGFPPLDYPRHNQPGRRPVWRSALDIAQHSLAIASRLPAVFNNELMLKREEQKTIAVGNMKCLLGHRRIDIHTLGDLHVVRDEPVKKVIVNQNVQ